VSQLTTRATPALIAAIVVSIDNDGSRWKRGNYTLDHATGVRIWTEFFGAHVYSPREIKLGFVGWLRVRCAIAKWKRRYPFKHRDEGGDIIAALRIGRS